ncbi:thioredoxin-like domain-containing protein [Sphingobacterium puteale]|uniref:thioredoxin-like domain-containing protein n=1 Tax=Sphingobacterium puteale TaxID=2420510 RepID=UPI003D98B242
MKMRFFLKIGLVLGCLPMGLLAQNKYTIKGELSNLKTPAKAYLLLAENGGFQNKDSVTVKNGMFQFNGTVDAPRQALISLVRQGSKGGAASNDYLGFFIENSVIQVTAKDSIKNATIEGSQAELESKQLEASTRPLTNIIIKMNDEFAGKPKDAAWQKASDSVAGIIAKIRDLQIDFVRSHANSYMGLYVYYHNLLSRKFNPLEMEPIFQQFATGLRDSELGKLSLEKIEATKRSQAGVKVTDFTQMDLSGKPFALSSLRGKYVLVDFWASWCAPCRAENPNLVKAYTALKDKNFEIVGVSLDQNKDAWANAVKNDGLPWIHVCDLKGWKNEAAAIYGVSAVPQNFLIDPNGVIIARDLRGAGLTEKLLTLIK